MPLPYDALALGRLGGLALYAGAPWVLGHLFRATGLAPYAPGGSTPSAGPAARPGGRRTRSAGRRWLAGHRTLRACLLLGVLEALLVSFEPAAAVVVVVAGAALAGSSVVLGQWRSTVQALWLALGATVVAGVLCLPWLIGVLAAGRGAVAVFGTATPTSGAASWGTLLRFSVGPIGDSPLTWAFVVAALLPLLLARGPRFRWAARCWSIAIVFWFVAWIIGRGWLGDLAIDPTVLLAPAAAATATVGGAGHRRLRGGPPHRHLRVAPDRHGGGGGGHGARDAPDAGLGRARAVGPAPERLRPDPGLDARASGRPGRSGSCGSATPGR